MEATSIIPVTLASILSSLPAPNQTVSKAVVNTHISPAIAGQWEIELPQNQPAKTQSIEPQPQVDVMPDGVTQRAHTALAQADLTQAGLNKIDSNQSQVPTWQASNTCRELYNFAADNNVRAVSGDEITYGKYIVTHLDDGGLPIIAIKTIYDNNEIDCSGNKVDQTGDAIVAYLKYSDTTMQWCADPDGEACFTRFNRILP